MLIEIYTMCVMKMEVCDESLSRWQEVYKFLKTELNNK